MAEVKLKFTADTHEAISGINRIKKSLGDVKTNTSTFASSLKGAFVAVTGAIATITGAAAGLSKGLKDVIDYAGELKDISDATGTSIKNIAILREEFRAAGVDMGKTEQILTKFSNKLKDPSLSVRTALKNLGIDSDDISLMPLNEQFDLIRTKISGLASQSDKLKIVADLFGAKNVGIIRMFDDSASQQNAMTFLGQLPDTMDAIAPTLESFGDIIDGLSVKGLQFFSGVASQLLKPIEDASGKLQEIDLTDIGKQVGSFVRDLILAFKNGDIWGLIIPGIVTALHKLTNEFVIFFAYVFYKGIALGFKQLDKLDWVHKIFKSVGFSPRVAGSLEYGPFRKQALPFLGGLAEAAPYAGAANSVISSANEAGVKTLDAATKALKKATETAAGASELGVNLTANEVVGGTAGRALNILGGTLKGIKWGRGLAFAALPILSKVGEGIFNDTFKGEILPLPKIEGKAAYAPHSTMEEYRQVMKDEAELQQWLDVNMRGKPYAGESVFTDRNMGYPTYAGGINPLNVPTLPYADTIGEAFGGTSKVAETLKEITGFIPNLTSLGKVGGAAGEVTGRAVLNFQQQTIKTQQEQLNTQKNIQQLLYEMRTYGAARVGTTFQ